MIICETNIYYLLCFNITINNITSLAFKRLKSLTRGIQSLHMAVSLEEKLRGFKFDVFLLRQKAKKTPQRTQPVASILNSTLTVQEHHTCAGWLVVNHCFQVIHFLSPCKTNVQIFKTLSTTVMLQESVSSRGTDGGNLHSCANADGGTGSGECAMVQSAASQ